MAVNDNISAGYGLLMFAKKMKNPIKLKSCMQTALWHGLLYGGLMFSLSAMADSVFDYPHDPDFEVIQYTEVDSMIINADPLPLLRIYGDGKVLVHYPAYMKRAGDYQMQLSDDQVQQLLASLEQNNILGVTSDNILKLEKQMAASRVQSSQSIMERSDDTHSNINVRLRSYIPAATGIAQSNFSHSVSIKNLKWNAQHYSAMASLKSAAAAEDELKALLHHPNLKKIK